MSIATIQVLIVQVLFLALGLIFLIKPNIISYWLKSFSRTIGSNRKMEIISRNVQERQATSRPIFIRILGVLFVMIGLWALLQIMMSSVS